MGPSYYITINMNTCIRLDDGNGQEKIVVIMHGNEMVKIYVPYVRNGKDSRRFENGS